ncbi:ribokinase [Paenibacillus arenilitoris]|uniref:Ribokinase n=1 Tax=Paenibacillus arenilitoris TaxID=2772299 RepID=A0A927H4M2_9BACL|nr:ribokinase [Paenibacillus arenilitoris]MBD2868040.1 ribokinase [Paenibacillus arenilitoris]
MPKLLVIGSINMDIVNNVKRFPLPGETIHSSGTAFFPGGKGANQAVAAARSGGDVVMIGAVGDDPFADTLVASLQADGIDTKHVIRKEGTSGFAVITVNDEGENNIILSEGANGRLTAGNTAGAAGSVSDVYAVLLQNEIPWETTGAAIEHASKSGVRVFVNPAPAKRLPDAMFPLIDTLIMNETEAAAVTGLAVTGVESARAAAAWAIGRGTESVIVTLGDQGSVYASAQGDGIVMPAFRVKPVDTTAAGDTFIGAYAAASANGLETEQALRFAASAAALAVTKPGAQASIPSLEEINDFLRERQQN